jgi:hypothetical protein
MLIGIVAEAQGSNAGWSLNIFVEPASGSYEHVEVSLGDGFDGPFNVIQSVEMAFFLPLRRVIFTRKSASDG